VHDVPFERYQHENEKAQMTKLYRGKMHRGDSINLVGPSVL
jgi:hypothetical protein